MNTTIYYLPLKICILVLAYILSAFSIAWADQTPSNDQAVSNDLALSIIQTENPTNNAAARQWPPETASRSYAQNYKDMALIQCIGIAYKDYPQVKQDIGASASIIFAWSDYDLEESTGKVPELIEQYLARHYELKPNGISERASMPRADLMKCLDMYHGPELETFIKLYVPYPERSFEQDNPELYNQ